MAWLLRDDDVLAVIEDRHRGWRRDIQGAVLVHPPALVHTFACANGLDVAWCSRVELDGGATGYRVKRTGSLGRNRLARPRLVPGVLVVAEGGAFERWKLRPGDQLEVRQV